jgi:lysophospholipase L1-like esterase
MCRLRTLILGKKWAGFWLRAGVVAVLAALLLFGSARRAQRLAFWLKQPWERGAVVFVGDSIIANWTRLPAAFPGWKVANRGLGGDSTLDVLRRLERDVLGLKPTAIVLLAGTNDLNARVDPGEVLTRIKAILQSIRGRFPRVPVVVCKLTPRGAVPGLFPERILQLNRSLDSAFAGDQNTIVFDTWSLFADRRGEPWPDDFPDRLHPSSGAYAKWASALQPVLTQCLRLPASAPIR